MGMVQRWALTAAVVLGISGCGGGGGADFETLFRLDEASAPYTFQYLGVATNRGEAVIVAQAMGERGALLALDRYEPDGSSVLVGFRSGTADGRMDEVGYVKRVRIREDRVEVVIAWTDDGVADDVDAEYSQAHVIVVDRADIPDAAMGHWLAVNSDGTVIADVTSPPTWKVEPLGPPLCLDEPPAGYEDLTPVCQD